MNHNTLPISETWPYLPTLVRLILALALGLFVGLERERRGKEAGVRTFAFASMLGCLGGMLPDVYALVSIALLALLVVFLNLHSLRANSDTEMTTSAALLVMGFVGVLCGKGHTFTPVAVSVAAAGLLAWKERLSGFSTGLTEEELRSAILLGIIGFVIYPVLPARPLDPWGLVEPRSVWITVILIAAIGFVNYVLLKIYGARGMEAGSFLGGLVNSTAAVAEVSGRVRDEGPVLADTAYRGTILASAAMLCRNAVLLCLLAPAAGWRIAVPLGAMLLGCVAMVWRSQEDTPHASSGGPPSTVQLRSPFSLKAALEFGLIFLVLNVAGALAQRNLGQMGFYAVSVVGGCISSASAVGSAGTLAAHGKLGVATAANGALFASLTSAFVSLPLVARVAKQRALTVRLAVALAVVGALGLAGLAVSGLVLDRLLPPHLAP